MTWCALVALACAQKREVTAVAPEQVIEVVGTEYAFVTPDSVNAGRTVFRLRNTGKVLHEMIILRLRPGSSVQDLLRAREAGRSTQPFLDGGSAVLFAPPGELGDHEITVDLEPGRTYALWCQFSDSAGRPEHYTLGMFKPLHVRNGVAGAAPPDSARVVQVGATDYAFDVPDTIDAGLVRLALQNRGKQRHELSFGRLTPAVQGHQVLTDYLAGKPIDYALGDDGAVLTAPGGDPNPFYIRVRLASGERYIMLCEFADTTGAPEHVKLGMFKELVVR
ncbi:MAG: hypothetical protein IT361_02630 [Gemmatimonadaceae bacterium]|nr:hypothetical protein [Gemmatimonadaceae bacterium]